MRKAPVPISLAVSQFGEVRSVGVFFERDEEERRVFRGFVHRNPFFVTSDEFPRDVGERRETRTSPPSTVA